MELFRRVKIALIIFVAVVISGTFGFWTLEPQVNSLLEMVVLPSTFEMLV